LRVIPVTRARSWQFARSRQRGFETVLANLSPHPAYVLLHHTHPPLRERVVAITQR
jgi:Zn-dependent protease with chaperone function